jgi:hypothetical protein
LATLAFRLSGGAAAPLAKLAGTCVEIVFVGIRLCDRLSYSARSGQHHHIKDRHPPRRIASYPLSTGFFILNLISSAGALILGLGMLVFAYNVQRSVRRRIPVPPDPWAGHTLEWATSSRRRASTSAPPSRCPGSVATRRCSTGPEPARSRTRSQRRGLAVRRSAAAAVLLWAAVSTALVILLACAALSAGLALAFGWWLLPVTGVLAALAVLSEIAGRHASPG